MLPWIPSNAHEAAAADLPDFLLEYGRMDVLMGRGTPSVRHDGNVFFRQQIWDRKELYVEKKANDEKEAVAMEVINAVSGKGGRFLQRITSLKKAIALGVPEGVKDVWVLAPEDVVKVKVKQCFR